MSNKDISHLQTLCNISDDYVDNLELLSGEELRDEYIAIFNEDPNIKFKSTKSTFEKLLNNKKKKLTTQLGNEVKHHKFDSNIIKAVIENYGSLKKFFSDGFINNSIMPNNITLQYRNMADITDEDIELLIEYLHEKGELHLEDDEQ